MTSLYVPYKAVGYVTDGKPFVVNRMGTETFLTVSIGKAFQVYRFNKLQVCMVSKSASDSSTITSLQVRGEDTFVAIGKEIIVYHRTAPVRTYNEHTSRILGLVQVGKYLISYDVSNAVKVIDTQKRCLQTELQLIADSQGAVINCLIHPATYINKFLVGFSDGQIELWNFNTKKIIYKFKAHMAFMKEQQEEDGAAGGEGGRMEEEEDEDDLLLMHTSSSDTLQRKLNRTKPWAVTALEQSPACDVVAIGFDSGHIVLLHMKQDAVLFSFKQDGAVTSLSFRTDLPSQKYPCLASGSSDGRVLVWCLGSGGRKGDGVDSDASDYNSDHDSGGDSDSDDDSPAASSGRNRGGRSGNCVRKLHCVLEDAHGGPVSRVCYMPGEPLLVTSSVDNSIKVWIFDSPDGTARLLRFREGHYGHPSKIRYYGGVTQVSMRDNAEGTSCEILSCGGGGSGGCSLGGSFRNSASGCGDTSFRVFNTAIEAQNREMSSKPMLKTLGLQRRNKKLPEVIDFDMCETRQRDWSNVVTVHRNHANVYLWRYKHRIISEIILRQPEWNPRNDNDIFNNAHNAQIVGNHATSCCMSACGNFAIVGTKSGWIYKYNVQSGLPRGSFPSTANASNAYLKGTVTAMRAATPGNVLHSQRALLASEEDEVKTSKQGKAAEQGGVASAAPTPVSASVRHNAAVTGLFVDIANLTMVSCSIDGTIIFWDFSSHRPLHCIGGASSTVADALPSSTVAAPASGTGTSAGTTNSNSSSINRMLRLEGLRDGGLVAIASQDRVVRLYDMSSFRLCRRFAGHSREITDLAFTPDGRRLLVSSLDNTVRLWDIPTGRCLSWMEFDTPVLSLTVSLSGEYLCVAQLDKEGILMYIDRSLYAPVEFWAEPTHPTPVQSCLVQADAAEQEAAQGSMQRKNKRGGNNSDSDSDDDEDDDGEDVMDADQQTGSVVKAVQAHVVEVDNVKAENASNDSSPRPTPQQRGSGSITLSAVPRAYWTTLFHLEAIKARNKPKEAAKPPPSAPFFLPTLNKFGTGEAGTAPSFPTPKEFQALMEKQQKQGADDADADAAEGGAAQVAQQGAAKKQKKGGAAAAGGDAADDDDARIMAELAQMGSAWKDDDDDDAEDDADDEDGQMQGDFSGDEQDELQGNNSRSKSTSAILRRSMPNKKFDLPRCKLAAYIMEEFPNLETGSVDDEPVMALAAPAGKGGDTSTPSPVLNFLISLPPSAIDLEFQSLCRQYNNFGLDDEDMDVEGISLLRCLLVSMTKTMKRGTHFEVLQAYLHRLLIIYSDFLVSVPELAREVLVLKHVHQMYTEKFRHMVQSNMCLLQILSKMPII